MRTKEMSIKEIAVATFTTWYNQEVEARVTWKQRALSWFKKPEQRRWTSELMIESLQQAATPCSELEQASIVRLTLVKKWGANKANKFFESVHHLASNVEAIITLFIIASNDDPAIPYDIKQVISLQDLIQYYASLQYTVATFSLSKVGYSRIDILRALYQYMQQALIQTARSGTMVEDLNRICRHVLLINKKELKPSSRPLQRRLMPLQMGVQEQERDIINKMVVCVLDYMVQAGQYTLSHQGGRTDLSLIFMVASELLCLPNTIPILTSQDLRWILSIKGLYEMLQQDEYKKYLSVSEVIKLCMQILSFLINHPEESMSSKQLKVAEERKCERTFNIKHEGDGTVTIYIHFNSKITDGLRNPNHIINGGEKKISPVLEVTLTPDGRVVAQEGVRLSACWNAHGKKDRVGLQLQILYLRYLACVLGKDVVLPYQCVGLYIYANKLLPLEEYIQLQVGQADIPKLESLVQQIVDIANKIAALNVLWTDLKPSNMLVDSSGKLWIIDYHNLMPLNVSADKLVVDTQPYIDTIVNCIMQNVSIMLLGARKNMAVNALSGAGVTHFLKSVLFIPVRNQIINTLTRRSIRMPYVGANIISNMEAYKQFLDGKLSYSITPCYAPPSLLREFCLIKEGVRSGRAYLRGLNRSCYQGLPPAMLNHILRMFAIHSQNPELKAKALIRYPEQIANILFAPLASAQTKLSGHEHWLLVCAVFQQLRHNLGLSPPLEAIPSIRMAQLGAALDRRCEEIYVNYEREMAALSPS